MSGIYIHIPFCKQACHYCDFHFSTSLGNKTAFIQALKKEMTLRKEYLHGSVVDTIYFGGGTPSVLSGEELEEIFHALNANFTVSPDAEITLEANPDDLDSTRLIDLKRSPVNRLSIGIQSFREEDLRLMNRAHNAAQASDCVRLAKEQGFANITIDLIYGIPGLDEQAWRQNLHQAFALDIQHISAYCLTVEPRTALAKFVKTGRVPSPDDEMAAAHFRILKEEMRWNEFTHYEISNFARPGFFSRHNSNYWKGVHYLGLGPSAHSFNGFSRQWNKANNPGYIRSIESGTPEFEKEELSPDQQYNEYVMTSLRTIWGCDLSRIKTEFGTERQEYCMDESEYYLQSGKLIQRGEVLILTDEGMLMADKIASDLFASSNHK
jgi:oxygen-independent coproporphyrinogen-3 oxidase